MPLLAALAATAAAPIAAQPAAQTNSVTFVDFDAGLSYASNPLQADDRPGPGSILVPLRNDGGSGYGRISARAVHAVRSERTNLTLSGFAENMTYLGDYGSEQIFEVDGRISRAVSETVQLNGSANFRSDLAGQLGDRFIPLGVVPLAPGELPSLAPTVPQDSDLLGLSGREYRFLVQVGSTITLSERDNLSLGSGFERQLFTGSRDIANQRVIRGSAAYGRSLSERASIGLSLSAEQADYAAAGSGVTTITPQLVGRLTLSERWTASGGIGVTFVRQDLPGGDDRSRSLSLDGNLCRTGPGEQICARVGRYSDTSAGNLTTTSASVNYSRQLDAVQSIQLAVHASHYSASAGDLVGPLQAVSVDSKYITAGAAYVRKLGDRWSAGANIGARKLSGEGPDRKADFNVGVFVRYRLGDLS